MINSLSFSPIVDVYFRESHCRCQLRKNSMPSRKKVVKPKEIKTNKQLHQRPQRPLLWRVRFLDLHKKQNSRKHTLAKKTI